MFFSNIYWPHLTGPFYWIHFETSIYQFNGSTFSIMPDEIREQMRDHSFIQNHSRSSDSQLLLFSSPHSSSTGFRSENTWHEIRDHSFIQNHSRSSDSQLLLFSSPHSSSTGFRSENTWHEIRDHSFIQNHSRSSDSQLLLFSSLTHLLQGSGQRTPDTRSETIPSSRITSDLQIHSFSSSVHLTHLLQDSDQRTPDTRSETIPSSRITPDLQINIFSSSVHSLIFYRVQIRGLAVAEAWFCVQWPIFVLFLRFVFGLLYGWKIQTWPIITESVTYWFYICWY